MFEKTETTIKFRLAKLMNNQKAFHQSAADAKKLKERRQLEKRQSRNMFQAHF